MKRVVMRTQWRMNYCVCISGVINKLFTLKANEFYIIQIQIRR